MATTQDLDRMLSERLRTVRGFGSGGDTRTEMELLSVTLDALVRSKDPEYARRVGTRAGTLTIERDGNHLVLTPSAPRAQAILVNANDLETVLAMLAGRA